MKIEITNAERTIIVAALMAYDLPIFAQTIADRAKDAADDGPEVAILSVDRSA